MRNKAIRTTILSVLAIVLSIALFGCSSSSGSSGGLITVKCNDEVIDSYTCMRYLTDLGGSYVTDYSDEYEEYATELLEDGIYVEGWYLDENYTTIFDVSKFYESDTTVYAKVQLTNENGTKGLKYVLNDTADGYIVYKGKANTTGAIYISDTYFGKPIIGVGDDAFKGCNNITSIYFPSTIIYIGSNAFYGCTGITSISLPEQLETIYASAFRNCSLNQITFNSNLKTISSYAFLGSYRGRRLIFNSGIVEIGEAAFSSCDQKYVYIPNSVMRMGKEVFRTSSAYGDEIDIYVESLNTPVDWHARWYSTGWPSAYGEYHTVHYGAMLSDVPL